MNRRPLARRRYCCGRPRTGLVSCTDLARGVLSEITADCLRIQTELVEMTLLVDDRPTLRFQKAALAGLEALEPAERLSTSDVRAIVKEFGAMKAVLDRADRGDLADLYEALGLEVSYNHKTRVADVVLGELAAASFVVEAHDEAVLVGADDGAATHFAVARRAGGHHSVTVDRDRRVFGLVGAGCVAGGGVVRRGPAMSPGS